MINELNVLINAGSKSTVFANVSVFYHFGETYSLHQHNLQVFVPPESVPPECDDRPKGSEPLRLLISLLQIGTLP